MKKETNKQQPKKDSVLNEEMAFVNQTETNAQNGQPVPQPKDYDEIEY